MKAKTLVELMSLGAGLYAMAKDKETAERISSFISSGKKKIEDYINELGEKEDGEDLKLVDKLIRKAQEAEKEFETKLDATAERIYKKMHIAHTGEIAKLQKQIDKLKKK
jgi:polyhydroxyalkanoate synthesis regulator phasin